MDAYDIFKKLTKGLNFKNKQLHRKIQPEPNPVQVTIKQESEDESNDDTSQINGNGLDPNDSYKMNLTSDLVADQDGIHRTKKKKKKAKKVTEKKLSAIEIEEAKRYRNELGIKVTGSEPAKPLKDFFSLTDGYEVPNSLVENLIQCGYMEPTPVQRQAIPCMLEGRQVLACAPTGSGKTAAFVLPVLNTLKSPQKGIRGLILCPTRELAKQTYREALRLSAGTNLSINFVPKISPDKLDSKMKVLRKTDLLISTPNRLCYLLAHESVNLDLEHVQWLIVDEADKLFEGSEKNESDFRPQLEKVMKACSTQTKLSLFSATQTPILVDWCRRNIDQLLCITVGQRNAATELVEQKLEFVGSESGKLIAFRQLIQKGLKPPVLVFVQSKDRAKQLFKELIYDGINVDVIHADRTQLQRDNVVKSFRMGKIWVLICTELMGRGIDFRGVNLVINYDFPPSSISYVHRIGRAGRAGQTGKAITFFTQDDILNLKSIVVVMRQSGCEVPEYMLTLNQTRKNRKKLLKSAPERQDISTDLESKRGKKRKMASEKAQTSPEKKRKFSKENTDSPASNNKSPKPRNPQNKPRKLGGKKNTKKATVKK